MRNHTILFRPIGLMPCNVKIDADVTDSVVKSWLSLLASLQPVLEHQLRHQKSGYLYGLQIRYQPNHNFKLKGVWDLKDNPIPLSASFQLVLSADLSNITTGEPVLYLEIHDDDMVYRAGVLYSTLFHLVQPYLK